MTTERHILRAEKIKTNENQRQTLEFKHPYASQIMKNKDFPD